MTLDEENGTPPPEFYGKRVTVRKLIRLHICLRGEVIFIELSRSSLFSYRISIVGGCKQYVSIIIIIVISNPSVRR